MRVYLDANIIVSLLNFEQPLFQYSARIVTLSDTKRFSFYTSPVALAIAFYFCSKKYNRTVAKKKIGLLCNRVEVAINQPLDVVQIVADKKIHDFEDGLQYYAAKTAKCDCIISEDTGDFYFSDIEVLTAGQFLEKYMV
jgi:predicted nucleic acid-binding protein